MFEQGEQVPTELLQAVVLTVAENSDDAKVKIRMNDLSRWLERIAVITASLSAVRSSLTKFRSDPSRPSLKYAPEKVLLCLHFGRIGNANQDCDKK